VNIVGKFPRKPVSEKTAQLNKKYFIATTIAIICFLLDRVSKIYIINAFVENNFKDQFVNKYLNFALTWNKGIAFGLFQSETFFYHFMSFIILSIILFIIFLIIKSKSFYENISLSMIVGGAIGNLFDRFYYNAVPDFIDLHYESLHWFTFNVSDICISIGIILILIFDIFKFNKNTNEKTF